MSGIPAVLPYYYISTHEFNELHNRIWSSLQAESMRGFEQQEKSA